MDYFDQVNKTIQEGQKRWKEIEGFVQVIQHEINTYDPLNRNVAQLLLLLVEHIRPMNPSKEQLDETTQDINNMLKTLMSLKK